jgi:glycosyltransferase involved in cell wall biosynthesis
VTITMVLPFIGMTGGTKVMLEYANRLQARGHKVVLIYPWYHTPPHNLRTRIKGPIKGALNALCRVISQKEIRWHPLQVPLKAVPRLNNRYLPDADILITTENQTIDPLESVSDAKGRKLYLIQHYETWTRDPKLVDATWRSQKWHKVAIASWLKRLAEEQFHSTADLVLNGVDLEVFHDRGRTWQNPPRILALYHHLDWKGVGDLLQAYHIVRAKGYAFTPIFFGHLPAGDDLKALNLEMEYHRFPTGEALRQLYAGADIFVSPSWHEGCQLPPMEAMACGAAVIATNVGGVPDYTVPNQTAVVVEPRQPQALAEAIIDLISHPDKMRTLAKAGHTHIQNFSWTKATDQFEEVLHTLAKKSL